MDLESECSPLESVTDNELIAPEGLENLGEIETIVSNNGTCYAGHDDDKLLDAVKVEGSQGKSPSDTEMSPRGSTRSSTPTATKGWGLRKWRRLRREGGKEGNSTLDSNKKRDLIDFSSEMKQRSDGSISSTNAMVNVLANDNALDHSLLFGDSGTEGGPAFAAKEDSGNSEDHSSRSSTAASAPRVRPELLSVVGLELDRSSMRSSSGKNSGITVKPVGRQGKGRTGTGKKARGVKIEKENSQSSMESDTRSSNFVFVQGTNSMTSNCRQSGRVANYYEEYGVDALNGDKHLNKEAQTAFSKNEAESEDVLQEDLAVENSWEIKEEKSVNIAGSMDRDALAESIMRLSSAQEALEREVQKLRDVGKDDQLFFDDSVEPSESSNLQGHEPRSSEELQPGESRPSSSNTLETEMTNLMQNVVHLQSKLKEARVMLELKEAKVFELESTLSQGDMKAELEEVFKQRIEAEVEYVAICRTVQNLTAGPIDQIKLMVQQKNLASEHVQVMDKLEGAESKATELKKQAEKLEMTCEHIIETEEVWKLRSRVCRYTSCFMIQLILLLLVLYVCVLQMSSHNTKVIPT